MALKLGDRVRVLRGKDRGQFGFICAASAGRKIPLPWPYWVHVRLDNGKKISATVKRLIAADARETAQSEPKPTAPS